MSVSPWDTEIRTVSDLYSLPYGLVHAVVVIESGGETSAWNPEPKYCWFWDVRRRAPFRRPLPLELESKTPPPDFPCLAGDPDQEWWAQQASWGLMQVMGAVARELGCKLPYLTALCRPEVGLDYGCRYLRVLQDRYMDSAGWNGIIAAYNAGSPRRGVDGAFVNQGYVDKVRGVWT